MMTPTLSIHNLKITHSTSGQVLLDICKLALVPHRTLAVVGESGAGKSLLSKAIMGLLPENLTMQGEIYFQGQKIEPENLREQWRGKALSLIVQNAMTAFNPLMRLGDQLAETVQIQTACSRSQAKAKLVATLSQVKLEPALLNRYPNQLSGGQLQRMMLALNLVLRPTLLIADEPTTALDSLTQAEILPLFQQLSEHSTMMFITHDLGVVRTMASDIAVLHQGKLVECCPSDEFFHSPQHPFSQFLLAMNTKLNQKFCEVMNVA